MSAAISARPPSPCTPASRSPRPTDPTLLYSASHTTARTPPPPRAQHRHVRTTPHSTPRPTPQTQTPPNNVLSRKTPPTAPADLAAIDTSMRRMPQHKLPLIFE